MVAQTGGFLRNTGEFIAQTPALSRPTLNDLQKINPKIARIERDTSPVVSVTMNLWTVLATHEMSDKKWIPGAEYEHRLAPHLEDLLGYQQIAWIGERMDQYPELSSFLAQRCYVVNPRSNQEWPTRIPVDAPGLIVVNEEGARLVPYLIYRGYGRFRIHWTDLANMFPWIGRVAARP